MFLLVLWVVLAILGFVVKGLMWLAWVAIILVVITLIIGFVAGIFSGGKPLYSTILERTLAKQAAEKEAKARAVAGENT